MPAKSSEAKENPSPVAGKPTQLSVAKIVIISALVSLVAGALGAFGYVQLVAHSSKPLSTELSKKEIVSQDRAVIDVASKVSPSVVSIVSSGTSTDIFGRTAAQQAAGTGIIVRADGLILTNKHVVESGQTFSVIGSDGKEYKDAKVVAKDPTNDIAFLKIDANGLTAATLGNSSAVEVGQTVIAIGNALGQFQNTVTTGVISGKSRPITAGDSSSGTENLQNLFQTDAAINPGNSGGPLVDIEGKVIGMNTAVAGEGAQNIGFAIPIDEVKGDITSVNSSGKIVKAYLGVSYIPITSDFAKANSLSVTSGAFLKGGSSTPAVLSGSPAQKAGLQEGDIITKVNDTPIDASHSLTQTLGQFKPGDTVTLTVVRQGKTITVKATLAESPSGQ